MATLDSFFPEGFTPGNGQKFTRQCWDNNQWFEPIFRDGLGYWLGLDQSGDHLIASKHGDFWKEWVPPKKIIPEENVEKVLKHCEKYLDIKWAADVVGLLLDCDFRDAKEKLKEHYGHAR